MINQIWWIPGASKNSIGQLFVIRVLSRRANVDLPYIIEAVNDDGNLMTEDQSTWFSCAGTFTRVGMMIYPEYWVADNCPLRPTIETK
jgi:hypothetical protein